MLVHLQAHEILHAYLLASVSFEESVVEQVSAAELPAGWRKDPAPPAVQAVGDERVARASSAILRVPSVLIDGEWNYPLKPAHPDFGRCVRGKTRPFRFDPRLAK